jgi:hypothetical protein
LVRPAVVGWPLVAGWPAVAVRLRWGRERAEALGSWVADWGPHGWFGSAGWRPGQGGWFVVCFDFPFLPAELAAAFRWVG